MRLSRTSPLIRERAVSSIARPVRPSSAPKVNEDDMLTPFAQAMRRRHHRDLCDLIGKRVLAGLDPDDGILGMDMF
jgi:hypothetical protein